MDRMDVLLMSGMLITGTVNTLAKNWQNNEYSKGIDGKLQIFHFPWTQTLIMYCGEAMCMVVFLMLLFKRKRDSTDSYTSRNINATEASSLLPRDGNATTPANTWTTPFLFLFASSLDLFGTTLGGIGLIYTYASVYQMLRGSIIIFSGILSVLFLKRKLYLYNWLGIGITTVGLLIVGWASLLADDSKKGESMMLFGDLMVIAGQFANAVQFIVEESYLKKRNFSPLLVVGAEGCWGIVLMCSIVLPIVYHIHGTNDFNRVFSENALDAAVMIGHNAHLLIFVLLYWLSIAFYNFFGLSVAKKLTAVHRTFIDALRTLFVWGAEIFIFYVMKDKTEGENWTRYSYMELGGFVLLVLGTATYNTTLRIPGLYYPPPAEKK